jgi:hypothetical protein
MRFVIASIFLLFLAIILFSRQFSTPAAIYVDSSGRDWGVPRIGWVTNITNQVIEAIPRLDYHFNLIDPDFDLDNSLYRQSSVLYIILCGSIGLFLLVLTGAALLCRHFCHCCKMKRFYPSAQIVKTRILIMLIAFVLEGILLYGYFANTDLHTAMNVLTDDFAAVGENLSTNFSNIIDHLPPVTSDPTVYNRHAALFRTDLEFSARYARSQSSAMETFSGSTEGYRMALILMNLILTTISCSVGVASGSINSEKPLFAMVICNAVAMALIFFSAGTHFAGSKIVLEYCEDSAYYLTEPGLGEPLPQRLQFFVPCIDSPVLPYIQDHFVVTAAVLIDSVRSGFQKTVAWASVAESPPEWFNISDDFYTQQLALIESATAKAELQVQLDEARTMAGYLALIDEGRTCSTTRQIIREHEFLLCKYLRDNLDMLTMTQVIGGIVTAILTAVAVSSLNLFRYAGKIYRRKLQRRRVGALG